MNIWIEMFVEYGLFFLQSVTILVVIMILLGGIGGVLERGKEIKEKSVLKVEKLNKKLEEQKKAILKETLSSDELKKLQKQKKKEEKKKQKEKSSRKKVYVIEFDGDMKASASGALSNEVNSILAVANSKDEVVAKITSPGGMVHTYGLCASQLQRIRDRKIPLTVCVDKVAASGGYLMAAIANRILAAPFSILGSIGVVSSVPNFHRILKKNNIDYEIYTSGKYKRTLTTLGKNTPEGKEKFQEQLETTHTLFKDTVTQYRPSLDMEKVATGEFWYGYQAKELNLIDEIQTSDQYLTELCETADVYLIQYLEKIGRLQKIKQGIEHSLAKAYQYFSQPPNQ